MHALQSDKPLLIVGPDMVLEDVTELCVVIFLLSECLVLDDMVLI